MSNNQVLRNQWDLWIAFSFYVAAKWVCIAVLVHYFILKDVYDKFVKSNLFETESMVCKNDLKESPSRSLPSNFAFQSLSLVEQITGTLPWFPLPATHTVLSWWRCRFTAASLSRGLLLLTNLSQVSLGSMVQGFLWSWMCDYGGAYGIWASLSLCRMELEKSRNGRMLEPEIRFRDIAQWLPSNYFPIIYSNFESANELNFLEFQWPECLRKRTHRNTQKCALVLRLHCPFLPQKSDDQGWFSHLAC